MKPFSSSLDEYQKLTNDTSSGNQTLGKILLNQGIKKYLASGDFTFNKDTKNYATGTGVMAYDGPYNTQKIDFLHYWYGGVWYTPKQERDQDRWRQISRITTVTSSIPQMWFVSEQTGDIEIYPASTDSKGTIKVGFTKKVRDYAGTNYSTGSLSASAGSTQFNNTGGALWNTKMAGNYIQIGATNTIIDGLWFEITSATGSTAVVKESIPIAVSSSTGTYTIVEPLPFPDGFEDLPLFHSLKIYYQSKEQPTFAREYERMETELAGSLYKRDQRSVQGVLTKEEGYIEDVNRNPWAINLEE